MKKPNNNIEFLEHYMSWGSPLNQVFVMDAVGKLVDNILKDKEAVLKAMENSFVHGPAWIKCAEDFQKQYEEFITRFDRPAEVVNPHPDIPVNKWSSRQLFNFLVDEGEIDEEDENTFDDWDRNVFDMQEMVKAHLGL